MKELPQITEHWKNLSLEPIVEEHEGVVYVEEWRPIRGYESQYHISSFGRVKSLNYGKTKYPGLLKPAKTEAGYLRVELVRRMNRFFIHILVAQHFIDNPENKPEVNHKKGITTDNRVHQLEWATRSEQMLHAIHVLGFKPKNPPYPGIGGTNWNSKKIKQIDINTGDVLNVFAAIKDAERVTGVGNSHICSVAKGKSKSAGGYKWEYV